MPSANRISVTTASTHHQKLLEYEAALSGRSVSSLVSSFLEEIVNQKVRNGEMHPTSLRLTEDLVKEREIFISEPHTILKAAIREEYSSNDETEKHELDPNEREQLEELLDRGSGPPRGYFTDGVWAQKAEPQVDKREQELVAYGVRYGIPHEEAEDIYEKWAHRPRYIIREEMRDKAGYPERLKQDEYIDNCSVRTSETDNENTPF